MLNVKYSYLFNDDKPFFWLGDTAWLLYKSLNKKEIIEYLNNRASLGFNVIQSILLFDYSDDESLNNLNNPNCDEYWLFVKEITEYAESLGIYFAYLLCWGSVIRKNIININDYEEYINKVTNLFKDNKNVIWVLGGDIKGDYNLDLFNKMGNLLKKNNPDKLITFHPFGRTGSYLWFNNENWLDFNMYQSGHRRYDQLDKPWDINSLDEATFGEDAYRYVFKAKSYDIIKPILDGEPSYEDVVQGLHNPNEPYWKDHDVRRYAYYGIFAGSCGFTYGHNSIIQFYDFKKNGLYGVNKHWRDALNAPGAKQLRYIKELMESVDYVNGKSDDSIVLNQGYKYNHKAVFKGNDYIFIYNYLGDKTIINLNEYKNKEMELYLINPENNNKEYYGSFKGINVLTINPLKRNNNINDIVIVLKEKKL